MNYLICFITLLLAYAPVSMTESYPVTTSYDRASDITTARIALHTDDSTPAHLTIEANAAFRGKEPNTEARFWFTLTVTRGQATRKTPPLLAASGALHLSLDETRLAAQLTEYRKEYYELIRCVSESAQAEIARADFAKLLAANRLSGQCGTLEFQLSENALAALKTFLTRQALATPSQ